MRDGRGALMLPEVYCRRCRARVAVQNPELPTLTATGRASVTGECSQCGSPVAGLTGTPDLSAIRFPSPMSPDMAAAWAAALRRGFEVGRDVGDDQRNAAILRLQSREDLGLTHREIAEIFGVSPRVIPRLLAQERRRLQELVGP